MPRDRRHDLVLFGATGFVGRLTAAHLASAAPPGTRIALGGRSLDRLTALRASLPPVAADWPLVVADTSDPASLRALAASTTAVATTVGPYARYGLPLVEACAAAGTHCADLTGEVPFVRRSADLAHELARSTGARIVHACGFDSVPSDLSALLTAEAARADGGTLTATTLVLVRASGGVSGGTVDSVRGVVDEGTRDAATRRLLLDPYGLSPDRAAEPELGRQSDSPVLGRVDGRWTGLFVMASFNTRIVRRSNALQDWAYGRAFRYSEVMAFGRSPLGPLLAVGTAAGLAGVGLGLALPPTRALLDRVLDRVLPAAGEGPSEATRDRGHFRTETTATSTTGRRYRTTFAMQGDPGYAATAVMLGQSGLSLALDDPPDERAGSGGVLTPATALGTRLVDRLRAQGAELATVAL
jgi:short subunit dehydrogenase-like uncharacterized protein